MINFADLDDGLNGAATTSSDAATIRANAHIANGGEACFPCPKCRGKGKVSIGYTVTRWVDCFKCRGKGKVAKGVAAHAKGVATREQTRLASIESFRRDHADVYEFIARGSEWSDFYRTMIAKLNEYGSLTDGQMTAIRNGMAKAAAKREERDAAKTAKSGTVEISAIAALFAKATDNDIKRPIFRAEELVISKAPANGKNAGALYVKSHDEVYLGKIVAGKFSASREAPADTLAKLQAVAADPTAEAIKYARRTGSCGCCGKGLVDPVSIRAGIGPICASNWGLDFRRELARDELKAEEERAA